MSDLAAENPIEFINKWYLGKCDGNWEHEFGVEIATIDNPGWLIKLTGENAKEVLSFELERADDDWIHTNSSATSFTGHGGSGNLNELLLLAVKWLQSN